MNQKGLRGRRQYSVEFKARVVALCQRDAALVAEVALAHDVDAALLRRWIRRHVDALPLLPPTLVPVQLEPPVPIPSDDSLRLDIRKGSLQVQVHCPASAADACAHLLKCWLA
jgi:transposase